MLRPLAHGEIRDCDIIAAPVELGTLRADIHSYLELYLRTAFTLVEEDFFLKKKNLKGYFPEKMPADIMEKNSSSPVAATPASMNTTPDKPKTASEHRKVCIDSEL